MNYCEVPFKDILTSIVSILALLIAWSGLKTWRNQIKGTHEHEVARNSLRQVYLFKETFQSVRNPMIHLSKDEVEAGRRLDEEQRIYEQRLTQLESVRSDMLTSRLEARVLWGETADNLFEPLDKAYGELRGAVWMHFWLKGAYAGPGQEVDRSPERVIENDKKIYYVSDEDELSQQVLKAIETLETFLRKKIALR